jgi:hypothetical protein
LWAPPEVSRRERERDDVEDEAPRRDARCARPEGAGADDEVEVAHDRVPDPEVIPIIALGVPVGARHLLPGKEDRRRIQEGAAGVDPDGPGAGRDVHAGLPFRTGVGVVGLLAPDDEEVDAVGGERGPLECGQQRHPFIGAARIVGAGERGHRNRDFGSQHDRAGLTRDEREDGDKDRPCHPGRCVNEQVEETRERARAPRTATTGRAVHVNPPVVRRTCAPGLTVQRASGADRGE